MIPTNTAAPATQTALTAQHSATAQHPSTIEPQPLTQAQMDAWLGMAVAKNNLVADLTRQELAAQSLLYNLPDNHEAIDSALSEYRKAHTNMVETRKTFTGILDQAIVQPLMAYEKRVDPKAAAPYIALANRSLELRKIAQEAANRANAINQEKASFKAHFVSEFLRTTAQYRQDIRNEIDAQYEYWLKQRITPEIPRIKEHLAKIAPGQPRNFTANLLDNATMQQLWNELQFPDYKQVYEDMMGVVDQVFANFDSDMANAEAAIAQRKEESAHTAVVEMNTAAEEAAINTLITTAETVTVEAPTVKRTYSIVVVESEQWAKTVMAAFITNLPALAKYIRVKSWAKLTIGQMAEYLAKLATEGGAKAFGLEYKEVEK